jgi:hypothetical protein
MCNQDTFNMDESGLYSSSLLARADWGNREGQEAHDCGPDCQRNWYTAAETHHHSHSAEASSVPKELQGGVCSECALVLQQDCLDALHSLPGLAQEGMLALNLLMI